MSKLFIISDFPLASGYGRIATETALRLLSRGHEIVAANNPSCVMVLLKKLSAVNIFPFISSLAIPMLLDRYSPSRPSMPFSNVRDSYSVVVFALIAFLKLSATSIK